MRVVALLCLSLLLGLAAPAIAAEPAPLPDSIAMLIQYFAAMAATVVVGWIVLAANRLFGVSLEARHREALHSALTTGASLVLSVLAEKIARGMDPERARSIATQHGVSYVRQSVPDALRVLKPADDLLFDMVRAKSAQLELTRNSPLVVDFGSQPTVPTRG